MTRRRGEPGDADRHRRRFEELSTQGFRVLGVATKRFEAPPPGGIGPDDETDLDFAGFLCFSDPPKADAADAIAELSSLWATTKPITGDNRYAVAHAAAAVGLDAARVLTGADIAELDEAGLDAVVATTSVFAEIEPLDKETIVAALRRTGHNVGYLGDGINDAPSLLGADVGISVDTAVDVAKYSAAVVLLDKDLAVLAEGIRQGRQVVANTLKYVHVTISANFGNMISMAAAAAFLPFLPLLPRQILLLSISCPTSPVLRSRATGSTRKQSPGHTVGTPPSCVPLHDHVRTDQLDLRHRHLALAAINNPEYVATTEMVKQGAGDRGWWGATTRRCRARL